MKLKQFIKHAEEFAKLIWPIKNKIKIKDIILRGSVARGVPIPVDLDMVIIHENPKLDIFQDRLRKKYYNDLTEEFQDIKNLIKQENLVKLFTNTSIEQLIKKNLFHTSYMNIKYFTNKKYRQKWNNQNDLDFPKKIFSEGILWNPKTQKYDIPATTKYSVPK